MVCFITLSVISVSGCAGRTTTTTVTTETANESAGDDSSTSVTTTEEKVTGARPHGVIGGLFYTIGQVLIFPFKVIGALF
ncbi:hypothetical protein ACFL3D_00375 [Candidatus Omnitrophota bacterium]